MYAIVDDLGNWDVFGNGINEHLTNVRIKKWTGKQISLIRPEHLCCVLMC